jgi:hypothetical protein
MAEQKLEKDPIVELKVLPATELGEDDYYKILESKSVWIQNRVNPILKALTFATPRNQMLCRTGGRGR